MDVLGPLLDHLFPARCVGCGVPPAALCPACLARCRPVPASPGPPPPPGFDWWVAAFAYEGAVNLTMAEQAPHANPVKGTSVEEEAHPTTKDWIAALFRSAQGRLSWVNCGLCVDERGAGKWIEGPVRGSPKEFAEWVKSSDATLVIPTN